MEREEFYDEERAFEAELDEEIELRRREEEEWDEFESNGFASEADYNQYRYGSSTYL